MVAGKAEYSSSSWGNSGHSQFDEVHKLTSKGLGLSRDRLLAGCPWKTSKLGHTRGILIRCQNCLEWLLEHHNGAAALLSAFFGSLRSSHPTVEMHFWLSPSWPRSFGHYPDCTTTDLTEKTKNWSVLMKQWLFPAKGGLPVPVILGADWCGEWPWL